MRYPIKASARMEQAKLFCVLVFPTAAGCAAIGNKHERSGPLEAGSVLLGNHEIFKVKAPTRSFSLTVFPPAHRRGFQHFVLREITSVNLDCIRRCDQALYLAKPTVLCLPEFSENGHSPFDADTSDVDGPAQVEKMLFSRDQSHYTLYLLSEAKKDP